MKPRTLRSVAVEHQADEPPFEELDYKDVYFLDEPDPESLKLTEARQAFEAFGYRVLAAQKPTAHPVYVLRLRRHAAPRFIVEDYFQEHIRDLLRSIGVRVGRAELPAERRGNQILVAFMWEPRRKSRGRQASADRRRNP